MHGERDKSVSCVPVNYQHSQGNTKPKQTRSADETNASTPRQLFPPSSTRTCSLTFDVADPITILASRHCTEKVRMGRG